jgi:hypothetical protein
MVEIDYSDLNKNQKKSGPGGKRPGAGRKKGSTQKLSGVDLLVAIHKATGKPFSQNVAEHYNRAVQAKEWSEVRDYEKFIIAKVISDTKEVDVTSNGETLKASFIFPSAELDDWRDA